MNAVRSKTYEATNLLHGVQRCRTLHRIYVALVFIGGWLGLLASICGAAQEGEDRFEIGPVPGWVLTKTNGLAADTTAFTNESEIYLSVDYQVNVAEEAQFVRVFKELRTSDGVQNGSTVSAAFDPGCQRLVWHSLEIVRAGRVVPRLQRDAFRVLRRESDLEWHMLDGSLSASALLQDVRPGDRIAYSYTIHGRNPVFGGRYSGSFSYGWYSKVLSERIRVLCPENRPLQFRSIGGDAVPAQSVRDGVAEMVWEFRDLPRREFEDRTPSWHVVSPWIEVSEWKDWHEVADWAVGLYPAAGLSEETEALVAGWKERFPDPVSRVQAALDHVQRDIRYLGLELGDGTHRPSAPEKVAERRFGDCKDKTYLLCTLLQRLGIKATPLLLDTSLRQTVGQRLPSPLAFNHVIALVEIDGRQVVVDPTASDQRGALLERYVPDYGFGLLVEAGQNELRRFGGVQGRPSEIEVNDKYTVRKAGEPADFEVETIARGLAAARLRDEFSGSRPEEVAKSYLNYYARFHKGIEPIGELRFEDDQDSNTFHVWERYRIRQFWSGEAGAGNRKFRLYPDLITGEFSRPDTRLRKFPLLLAHPRRVVQTITARLPDRWTIDSTPFSTNTAGFSFDATTKMDARLLTLRFSYTSLTNLIAPELVESHLQAMSAIEDTIGFSFPETGGESKAYGILPSVPIALVGVLSIAGLTVGAVSVYRGVARRSSMMPPPLTGVSLGDDRLRGLGGWLVLVAFGLIARPFMMLWAIVQGWPSMTVDGWRVLTDHSSHSYNVIWAPYLVWALIVNLTLFAASVLALVFFFQRRRIFPKVFIGILVAGILTAFVDGAVSKSLPGGTDVAETDHGARGIVTGVIWCFYMVQSRRVRVTFTR
jgi:transglutaminase-like putative cysteine protease